MILYTTLLLLCFFPVIITEMQGLDKFSQEKSRTKCLLIIVIYMILLCGLRSYSLPFHVGIDTHQYYKNYVSWGKRTIHDCFAPEINDKGYAVIQWLFAGVFHLPFTISLIIFAAVYIGIMGKFIYTYSNNKMVSMLIFITMGLYIFAFSAIRQSMAMGLCLAAYMYSDKHSGPKGFFVFALLVWLAYTIHASAIIFLAAYFLQRIRLNTKFVVLFLIVAAVVFAFKEQASNWLLNLAANTSEKYEAYSEVSLMVEERNAGMKLYIFIAFIILLRMIFRERIHGNEKEDNLIYMMITTLVIFPATQGGGAIMRIYYYYYMFIVVYLPNVIESIRLKNERRLVYFPLTIFLMWFYFFTALSTGRIVPYYPFWR